ncbi:unnamed protein product [Oikopleura dioica]|uniref:CID domain-containing protein n=1 Tax=Oikopleura dioica TaxID=34765 RepID=E4XT19_OIKDI|nr:unnamed protein product [Oikopleura dioica]
MKIKTPENPLIDILGAPKPRIASESQKKNLSVASELKNSLNKKKKSTPPQGPPKKLAKSESEGSLKNNGAPLIPKGRIPMKKKSDPSISKDDAPDIMDTSVVDPPPQAHRPAKISSSSKGSVNVRRPRITNTTEILENFTIPQVREMAETKLRTGLMNRRDYDVLMNRLSVLEKIEKDKKAARSGDSQEHGAPQRRDEDNRTRQPWYSHGTPQDREIYHEHPQRQQDWRDTLWDQYHTVHGDPVPRGSARGPPPPGHDPWKYDPRNERPPGPPSGPERREMMDPRRGPHPQDLDHRRSVSPNISANVPPARNYVITDDLPMPPRPPIEDRPAPANPAPAAGLDLSIDLETVKKLLASVESNNASASQEVPKKEVVDAPPKKYIILPDAKKAEARRTPTPPLEEDSAPIANLDEVKDDMDDSKLPKIEFTENAIKNRIDPFIKRLYAGIQCSACGMRFKKSDSSRYADHLDWHFRVNKQLKNGQLDTHRKWYYKAWDWIMYEEIEDAEKRAEPMDEQSGADPVNEKKETAVEEAKVKTLPVTAGESCCAVCGERFQTAYDDDEDEWHYQDVVIHKGSGKIVHTGCLEDAGNLHVPRMVRSDSIDSIEMEKAVEDEDGSNIDEDTAQDIGIEMNKMNVSPPREKSEEKQSPEDVEMKEDPQGSDLPQSPKVEPADSTPTEQPPVKAEIAEPDQLDETNLYGDLAEAELEDINMSFEAPISPHAV